MQHFYFIPVRIFAFQLHQAGIYMNKIRIKIYFKAVGIIKVCGSRKVISWSAAEGFRNTWEKHAGEAINETNVL